MAYFPHVSHLPFSVLQVCEEALEYQLLIIEDGGHDGGGDGKVVNGERFYADEVLSWSLVVADGGRWE